MHYSLFLGMLLLDKFSSNKPERLEGWKRKSSQETRSRCQDREEREIGRGSSRGKRGEGRGGRKKGEEAGEGDTCVHLISS